VTRGLKTLALALMWVTLGFMMRVALIMDHRFAAMAVSPFGPMVTLRPLMLGNKRAPTVRPFNFPTAA
jgi:hypothetical protein